VTPERRSAQAIDSYLLPKNWGEPMGAPAIFEKQIKIKLQPFQGEKITSSKVREILKEQCFGGPKANRV
jgi:hypothetical protein